MTTDDRDVLAALPPSMRRRFTSLGRYTGEVTQKILKEQGLTRKQRAAFMREYLTAIRYVVLVIAISRSLKEGIAAAERAIKLARSLGQDGILIGVTEFSSNSGDLESWRELDNALDDIVRNGGLIRFASGSHVWNWVSEMVGEIQRG